MASRTYWKGYLRLSFVSFKVKLHPAVTTTEKISLHQFDKDSGDRIRYQKVDEDGDEVPNEDIVQGYEYEKGSFVPIDDEDLEKLKLESKHTIDLVQFNDIDDIDPIYFEKSYYMVPDGKIAEEAFLTVRDALRSSNKVAVGQAVFNKKERIVCVRPCCNGLIMYTLRYAYEVREAEQYFKEIPRKARINKEQLELAELLIEQKTKEFDPKSFKNHYQEGLLEIIKAKLKGKKPSTSSEKTKTENIIEIVDALKKSLEISYKKSKKIKSSETRKKKIM